MNLRKIIAHQPTQLAISQMAAVTPLGAMKKIGELSQRWSDLKDQYLGVMTRQEIPVSEIIAIYDALFSVLAEQYLSGNIWPHLQKDRLLTPDVSERLQESISFMGRVSSIIRENTIDVPNELLQEHKDWVRLLKQGDWTRLLFALDGKPDAANVFEPTLVRLRAETKSATDIKLQQKVYDHVRWLSGGLDHLLAIIPLGDSKSWKYGPETWMEGAIIANPLGQMDLRPALVRAAPKGQRKITTQTWSLTDVCEVLKESVAAGFPLSISLKLHLANVVHKNKKHLSQAAKAFRDIFGEAIKQDRYYAVLSTMRDIGLLDRLIGDVKGLFQWPAAHSYPVDEHSLQAIRTLETLVQFAGLVKEHGKDWHKVLFPIIQSEQGLEHYLQGNGYRLLTQVGAMAANEKQVQSREFAKMMDAISVHSPFDASAIQFCFQGIQEYNKDLFSRLQEVSELINQQALTSSDKKAMVYALLLHDVGKSNGWDGHEMESASRVEARLGQIFSTDVRLLNENVAETIKQEIATIKKLVHHHNILSKLQLDPQNPIYGYLPLLVSDPMLVFLITVCDRGGLQNRLKLITSNEWAGMTEFVRVMLSNKQLNLSVSARFSLISESMPEAPQYLLAKDRIVRIVGERFMTNLGNFYTEGRGKLISNILKDMYFVELVKLWMVLQAHPESKTAPVKVAPIISYIDAPYLDPVYVNGVKEGVSGTKIVNALKTMGVLREFDINLEMLNKFAQSPSVFQLSGLELEESDNLKVLEILKEQVASFKPRLVVYTHDYVGLAADLLTLAYKLDINPTSMKFITGKDGTVIDEINLEAPLTDRQLLVLHELKRAKDTPLNDEKYPEVIQLNIQNMKLANFSLENLERYEQFYAVEHIFENTALLHITVKDPTWVLRKRVMKHISGMINAAGYSIKVLYFNKKTVVEQDREMKESSLMYVIEPDPEKNNKKTLDVKSIKALLAQIININNRPTPAIP